MYERILRVRPTAKPLIYSLTGRLSALYEIRVLVSKIRNTRKTERAIDTSSGLKNTKLSMMRRTCQ